MTMALEFINGVCYRYRKSDAPYNRDIQNIITGNSATIGPS